VLRAGERAARRDDRLIAGVAEHLRHGDHAIAILVGGAAQPRQQVMREERAAEPLGLLGVLGQRAGGQHDHALAGERRGERERRGPAALDAGDRAGATGVDDEDPHGRGRAADQRRELAERQRGGAEVERIGVAVARVVDQQHRPGAVQRGADPLVDRDHGAARLRGGPAAQHDLVLARHAADVGENVGDTLGVALGVAQRRLVGRAPVIADHHCVTRGVRPRQRGRDKRPHSECGSEDGEARHDPGAREPPGSGTARPPAMEFATWIADISWWS
jgi:hypothetical protein